MSHARATIFALSSGRPPAAIAVIRISGPRARDALQALTSRVPEPRRAALVRVRDPGSGEILDEALVLWFPAPHSETGEDTAELQLHGGRAVIAGVLGALGRLEGFRPAEAGEFTRRAFQNGQLDLTQVEGLADLIYADTEAQRRQAFRHLKGLLGERAETWRTRLIEALALVEAGIDFSDEADVSGDLIRPALRIAGELRGEISAALAGAARGERLREGLVVAIAGPPNAGKSTLLNRIARREAAIVSPYAGTTRDVIEVHLDLEGYPITLLDTAGIRDSDDPVEQEGVRRARQRAAEADLVLWVVDAADPPVAGEHIETVGSVSPEGPAAGPHKAAALHKVGEPEERTAGVENLRRSSPHTNLADERPPLAAGGFVSAHPETWVVRNKVDLTQAAGPAPRNSAAHPVSCQITQTTSLTRSTYSESEFTFTSSFHVSARTGLGMDQLIARLVQYARDYLGSGEPALVTRARHRAILEQVFQALGRALAEDISEREDMLAEELRLAARGLGKLTGRVDVEDVLDVIFRDFCIGK